MSPKLSVYIPSFNKGGYAVEAVRSVFGQSFEDWELWLMENSTDDGKTRNLLEKFTDVADPRVHYEKIEFTPEERRDMMVCARLNNTYFQRANGEIIMYLSDDDLFMPGIFAHVVNYFDENPEHGALYFHLARTVASNPGEGKMWGERFTGIAAEVPRGVEQVDCIIDGGQIAYRKTVLDALPKPYFYEGTEPAIACHADGMHLRSVCDAGFLFYPLPYPGVIHRHTPISTWSKNH